MPPDRSIPSREPEKLLHRFSALMLYLYKHHPPNESSGKMMSRNQINHTKESLFSKHYVEHPNVDESWNASAFWKSVFVVSTVRILFSSWLCFYSLRILCASVAANAVDDIDIWNQPRLCQDLLWGGVLFEYFILLWFSCHVLCFSHPSIRLRLHQPHPLRTSLLKFSFAFALSILLLNSST